MFTLAISSLTICSLPWFMDITCQVPMQCYSLQHWNLLSPSDISITEHYFCFGLPSLFFLELFLYSSLKAYWTPTNLGNSSSSAIYFCLFITVHGVLESRILEWFSIPFSSGPCDNHVSIRNPIPIPTPLSKTLLNLRISQKRQDVVAKNGQESGIWAGHVNLKLTDV